MCVRSYIQDSANKGLVQEIVFLVFHRCLYNKQNITRPLVARGHVISFIYWDIPESSPGLHWSRNQLRGECKRGSTRVIRCTFVVISEGACVQIIFIKVKYHFKYRLILCLCWYSVWWCYIHMMFHWIQFWMRDYRLSPLCSSLSN